MDDDALITAYQAMYRIRRFEETMGALYRDGKIPGMVHSSIGQEACPAGVCLSLDADDFVTSTHRGHGHGIARGMQLDRMAAELYGKVDGYGRGKGGSMHIADPELGMLGANGIVGAGLPIAVGAGLVCQLRGHGVAVAFFGEGATTTGAFHESLNLAAIWDLPVLFVCENNGYVEFTPWSRISRTSRVSDLADGYGIQGHHADGLDIEVVHDAAEALIRRLRSGDGPFLLELTAFRYRGHYEGDLQPYRDSTETRGFAEVDPVVRARRALDRRSIVSPDQIDDLEAGIDAEMDAALEFAKSSAFPDEDEVDLHV